MFNNEGITPVLLGINLSYIIIIYSILNGYNNSISRSQDILPEAVIIIGGIAIVFELFKIAVDNHKIPGIRPLPLVSIFTVTSLIYIPFTKKWKFDMKPSEVRESFCKTLVGVQISFRCSFLY